jgi:hypothetical protein
VSDEHEHSWQLTEDGYTRQWETTINDDGTIEATYGGAEDWSEEGDGYMYLECLQCGVRKPVDPDLISYDGVPNATRGTEPYDQDAETDTVKKWAETYPQDAAANAVVQAALAKGQPPF